MSPPPPPPPRPRSPKSSGGTKSPPRSPSHGASGGSGSTTLRLNLPGSKANQNRDNSPKRSISPKPPSPKISPANSTSPNSSASKKRKYNPPASMPPHLALASFARLYHQTSQLSFVLHEGQWSCRGEVTLYVVDTAPPLPNTTQLALNLRGSCLVDSVKVETMGEIPPDAVLQANIKTEAGSPAINKQPITSKLETWNTSFDHMDPLEHVLIKPAASYTEADILEEFQRAQGKEDPDDNKNNRTATRYDADTQCMRGATGMTTSLRAASIASNMGELRLTIDRPNSSAGRPPLGTKTGTKERIKWLSEQWKHDLEQQTSNMYSNSNNNHGMFGKVAINAHETLQQRTNSRREARLDLVAQRLAEASDTEHGRRAFKITVRYDLMNTSSEFHAGGIHVLPSTSNLPPHIYTTAGVFGDHEGARSWLPCLDSAFFKHRASHHLTIQVTAPMRDGISVLGCGEDCGVHDTYLHHKHDVNQERQQMMKDYFGIKHVHLVEETMQTPRGDNDSDDENERPADRLAKKEPHVIPPDSDVKMEDVLGQQTAVSKAARDSTAATATQPVTTLDTILATQVWASTSWMPVPARSIGFAIGPFLLAEDPEYFGLPDIDDQDDQETMDATDTMGAANLRHRRQLEMEREQERIEDARVRGEGIRQAYLAPIYERKYIHLNAKTLLLEELPAARSESMSDDDETLQSSGVEIRLLPKTSKQTRLSKGLEETILFASAGVPHRALSLMRDILALPSYRTSAYTQVWIPNAVNGGYSCGALHSCPEVLGSNTFLGGAIIDAGLLPPIGRRIPFYKGGGRVLQMLQARCAIRGWIIAALPLGGQDDVGFGYIHSLVESLMMSFYERGHGANGEGGAKGSLFYTKRYSAASGLNSTNLDFLPVRNVEETADVAIGGVMAAVPVEDRNNDQLWRSASNGTESHTSAMDEFAVRHMLCRDAVDALERGTDKDKYVPMPSMGWLGSHLCLSFLSSNATSSSDLGGGALELVHPTGGLVYRALKSEILQKVVEGRAGVANFIRLVRAAFIASHLDDMGEKELKMPSTKKGKGPDRHGEASAAPKPKDDELVIEPQKPRFIICVNEILKKKGLTHTLFTRALQNLAGRIREALLLGRLVDIERDSIDPRTKRPNVDPEGFPNSFVRGASSLYLRVGVHVEVARDSNASSAAANPGGIQLQAYAEPVIPEGGIAYSGPITFRIVENEGQFREFVKDLSADGSRRDWGLTHLHAKPVTTSKAQTAASGVIETTSKDKSSGASKGIFSSSILHGGGYQAIELIRLTNLTPLLWVRVDPMGLYCGRISVFQPDAMLSEQLFHDGDAGAQVEAMRSLAERPLRIQGSVKVTSVYDVKVSELPVRVLGDCLRGSPALHSSLPHTPAVRVQAAYAIAQWQNNKSPQSSNVGGVDNWIGLNLLIQYFKERYYSNGVVMPVKFTRIVLKKNEVEAAHEAAAAEGGGANPNPKEDHSYQYLDSFDDGLERASALEEAEEIDIEEDEEYRVRAAVITSIASIRAKDGTTPSMVLQFLETILEGEDTEMAGNVVYPDEDVLAEKKSRRARKDPKKASHGFDDATLKKYPYVSSMLVADSLLSLCHINASPALITDPTTGKPVQSTASHPVSKLIEISMRWLQWELYRESIRTEAEADTMTGIGARCHDSVAACAITALASLAILRQSTTDAVDEKKPAEGKEGDKVEAEGGEPSRERKPRDKSETAATVGFYTEIFDRKPVVSDLTKAACAQAIACIYCASDRFEKKDAPPAGLLSALEFLLDRIIDPRISTPLKHTLALLMMDACTGKICSMQRVAAVGGRNELVSTAARVYNGPLGASHGGDSGSACLVSVSPSTYPAANAVNDGARRGLRLLSRAGHPRETAGEDIVVRIARFATNLWRTINGEAIVPHRLNVPEDALPFTDNGVCAYDGHLRCALLSLWQWIWPNRCLAVLQVQAWKSHEGTKRYTDLGAHHVMKFTDEEKAAAAAEEKALEGIDRLVNVELDRQKWRGEMAMKAYELQKNSGAKVDVTAAEQGIGQPLPPIQRDTAFKNGGWVSSCAQQRRALALDGGTAVTKLRLTVKGSD